MITTSQPGAVAVAAAAVVAAVDPVDPVVGITTDAAMIVSVVQIF